MLNGDRHKKRARKQSDISRHTVPVFERHRKVLHFQTIVFATVLRPDQQRVLATIHLPFSMRFCTRRCSRSRRRRCCRRHAGLDGHRRCGAIRRLGTSDDRFAGLDH